MLCSKESGEGQLALVALALGSKVLPLAALYSRHVGHMPLQGCPAPALHAEAAEAAGGRGAPIGAGPTNCSAGDSVGATTQEQAKASEVALEAEHAADLDHEEEEDVEDGDHDGQEDEDEEDEEDEDEEEEEENRIGEEDEDDDVAWLSPAPS